LRKRAKEKNMLLILMLLAAPVDMSWADQDKVRKGVLAYQIWQTCIDVVAEMRAKGKSPADDIATAAIYECRSAEAAFRKAHFDVLDSSASIGPDLADKMTNEDMLRRAVEMRQRAVAVVVKKRN
jgi:hypothetical protein